MPEISRFLGIVIAMLYQEHGPPHFHAVYAGRRASIEIETGKVIGNFPPRATKLVLEWLELHRDELLSDWQLARERKPLKTIEPLE